MTDEELEFWSDAFLDALQRGESMLHAADTANHAVCARRLAGAGVARDWEAYY